MLLILDAGIVVMPGGAYGMFPYFRLSYALNDADLAGACQQIEVACDALDLHRQ